MRTKPYAGEQVIYKPRRATWRGPGHLSISDHMLLNPMQQKGKLALGTACSGKFYITNKRIIFEGDEISKECIIYLEETKAFRYERGGWLAFGSSLYVTKENSPEEEFTIENAEPNITNNLHYAREAAIHTKAIYCEEHLDYTQAIGLWDKLGKSQETDRVKKLIAKRHEKLLEFDEAANVYKELGMDDEVIRIRKLKSEERALNVDQTVVQGDQITKTEIKDSVLNRSNVGGGSSKMQELKDLAEMKKEGLISDKEYEKMKQEIIGK